MDNESKPPMRQIAELIDEIATKRAEDAERLLTICEHQLTLARNDVADRDAEISRLKAELEQARAELSGLQCAVLTTPEQRGGYATVKAPPIERYADVERYLSEWAEGRVSTPIVTPPAEDPRIAALCRVVEHLADPTWPKPFGGYGTSQQFRTDLETIAGRR